MSMLAILSFSFAGAVFCANYLPLEWLLLPLGCGFALAFGFTFLPQVRKLPRGRTARYAAFGLALGCLWTAGYSWVFWRPAELLDEKTVRLTATVSQWPQETDYGGFSVLARADTEGWVTVPILLYVDDQGADLRPGDRIETVTHCALADHASSGEEITYYTAKGIFLTGQAYGRLEVERPDHIPLRDWPAYWSQALKESISKAFPSDVSGLVQALVTGNRDSLSDPFTTSLQRAGLSHTVAVSGMHLAFLAGLLSLLFGGWRRLASLVTIPVTILFTLTAGCTPSVVRAAVMILLLHIGPLFYRERDEFTSLGGALLLLLLYNPFSAAHIGLQLSFAAVAGIFLCAQPLQTALMAHIPFRPAERWTLWWAIQLVPKFIVSTFCATLGASVFTVPLSAIYFQSVSLIAPLSNLLTLWAVGILFGAGVLIGTLGVFVPELAALVALPIAPLGRYLNAVIDGLSSLTFSAVTTQSVYYRAWLVLVYLILILIPILPGKKRWIIPTCCGVTTLCLAMLLNAWSFWWGSGAVTVLDVGQGQSVLVRSGQFLCLVDCGGDGYDSAGDIAADFLGDYGVGRLDLLVLTHFHVDHANGVAQLLKRLQVDTLAIPPATGEEEPLREEILSAAQEQGVEVLEVGEDTLLTLDQNRTIQLYAPLGAGETNEAGLTCLVSNGDFDTLITGDMGSDVEQQLLAHAALPDLEVLVAGHHGSKSSTSEQLLAHTAPDYAFLSAGEHNSYGHPAQETLERLAAAGCRIYRTDLQGTITLRVGAQPEIQNQE